MPLPRVWLLQDATPVGPDTKLLQEVVVQLLPPFAELLLHALTPVGPVLLNVQTVAVKLLPLLALEGEQF